MQRTNVLKGGEDKLSPYGELCRYLSYKQNRLVKLFEALSLRVPVRDSIHSR